MYLKSYCALFLLALVACQAAPSSPVAESTSEAETFTNNNINLEDTGAEKDRAKKSTTTFCVEVRSGKPEQVPCKPEILQGLNQEPSKPLVNVQPVLVPVPVPAPTPVPGNEYPKLNIPQPSQPVQPQATPSPALPPIINIVPSSPPCDRPAVVQPPQPHFHTIHVIHPQLQPQPQPQPQLQPKPQPKPQPQPQLKPQPQPQPQPKPSMIIPLKEEKRPCVQLNALPSEPLLPLELPLPQTHYTILPKIQHKPSCSKYNSVPSPVAVFIQPQALTQELSDCDNSNNKETYECNCRQENRLQNRPEYRPEYRPENIIPTLTPHARAMMSGDMTFESLPHLPMMLSDSSMPDHDESSMFISEGARRAEGKHRIKQYRPVNLSVQMQPVVLPSDNFPKYYASQYPSYTNSMQMQPIVPSSDNSPKYYAPQYPYTNSYPNTYGSYVNYGASNPSETYYSNYGSQDSASNIPSVTVNAGGPFYGRREFQHTDVSSLSDNEALPREVLSTTTKIMDTSISQKRKADMQMKDQEEIVQKMERKQQENNSVNQHS